MRCTIQVPSFTETRLVRYGFRKRIPSRTLTDPFQIDASQAALSKGTGLQKPHDTGRMRDGSPVPEY